MGARDPCYFAISRYSGCAAICGKRMQRDFTCFNSYPILSCGSQRNGSNEISPVLIINPAFRFPARSEKQSAISIGRLQVWRWQAIGTMILLFRRRSSEQHFSGVSRRSRWGRPAENLSGGAVPPRKVYSFAWKPDTRGADTLSAAWRIEHIKGRTDLPK